MTHIARCGPSRNPIPAPPHRTLSEHVAAYGEWWAIESRRAGTDWAGLIEAHLGALEILGFLGDPFELACGKARELSSGGQLGKRTGLDGKTRSQPRPTPQTTIEAIKHTVRDRGIAALKEPATRQRLAYCDEAARAEVNRWLQQREAAA